MILEVLKNLDLRALCRMSQVNKYFNNLTRDWSLYICLNVRCVRFRNSVLYMSNIFEYFTPRCKYLQQLDITASNFFNSDFEKFLDNCGRHLTHLRLSKCLFVDNDVLLKISKICKNLKSMYVYVCEYNINKIIGKLHCMLNTFFFFFRIGSEILWIYRGQRIFIS